jgi:hypothetical protein
VQVEHLLLASAPAGGVVEMEDRAQGVRRTGRWCAGHGETRTEPTT